MNIIDRIKNSFYQSVLRQRGAVRPVRTVINLADAKTAGIIYDASLPEHDAAVAKFAEMMKSKGKTVEIMAYVNDKKIETKEGMAIFNPKAVNWYGVPLDERVSAYCAKPFDLLICAITEGSKPLEYIAYMSKAKYRVGPFDEQKTKYYDLMIEMGEKKDLGYLLGQMTYFLEKIQSK